jgi:histidyl-tRNA synthetase
MSDTKQQRVQKIAGVKGMNDLLPSDAPLWEHFDNAVRSMLRAYGYQQIRTPIIEQTQLFVRGIGEVTDIVEKEMYSFTDALNGEQLTMRPEGTAAAVRAVIEHNLLYDGPKRLWYTGPMFRHERPQRGRYRQFHQVGVEALGFAGPDIDAEVILMCQRLWDDLGLVGLKLELNSLGQAEERAAHRADLIKYLEGFQDILDEDSKRRLYTNPLRVLDTKVPEWQELVERAPQLTEHLSDASFAHFEQVQEGLQALGIKYELAPRLVRGFDYYTRTTFEFQSDALDAAQNALGGGGRYDGLAEDMGGPATPGIGFGTGIERLVHALEAASVAPSPRRLDAFVIDGLGDAGATLATVLVSKLREEGLGADRAFGGRSVSAQWKVADRSGARFAVMLGRDEATRGAVAVKDLESGEQVEVPERSLATWLQDHRGGADR